MERLSGFFFFLILFYNSLNGKEELYNFTDVKKMIFLTTLLHFLFFAGGSLDNYIF